MTGRRILYAVSVILAFAFYLLYRQWFSWLLLLGLLWLPVLSLALSLPAMLTVKATLRCPEKVRTGVPGRATLELACRFPHPPVKTTLRFENLLSGERFVGVPGEHVPAKRCGLVKVHSKALKVYDYLGLFCRKIKHVDGCDVYVYPRPLYTDDAGADAEIVSQWIPKPGGGFAENHDLRPFREGDNPRLIHWKLAAKTGKLIYREPIVPLREERVLVVTLSGSAAELERKLGRLLWLSGTLVDRGVFHTIFCRTGKGDLKLDVADLPAHEKAMEAILGSPATSGEWYPEGEGYLCVIGGAEDEA